MAREFRSKMPLALVAAVAMTPMRPLGLAEPAAAMLQSTIASAGMSGGAYPDASKAEQVVPHAMTSSAGS
ncbi:MAG TPA: hypothetical protein VGQ96_05775 [Candidatus Eremiobacteraceae bacterium]|nr:hypothetical protein [Candidatus Eremiobacteraceae bacterium]